MLSILEAAKSADLSKDRARYWLKLLDIEPIKKDRILLFPNDSSSMLEAMKKAVSAGLPPVAAAAEIRATFAAPAIVPEQPGQNNAIMNRLHDLESAVLLLVESNQRLSADNKQLSERNSLLLDLVQRQSRKLDKIAARLPAPPEPAPIQKIQKIQKTEAKLPLFKRIWLELFNPQALRATP